MPLASFSTVIGDTNITLAELCHKYSLNPSVFYSWKDKFTEGGSWPWSRQLALRKPLYGSRMRTTVLSKELGRPVNRKLIQHAFRIVGWAMPQMTKKRLAAATHERPKPPGINKTGRKTSCMSSAARMTGATSLMSLASSRGSG